MTPSEKAQYLFKLFTPKECNAPTLIAEVHATALCDEMLKETLRPEFWREVKNKIKEL